MSPIKRFLTKIRCVNFEPWICPLLEFDGIPCQNCESRAGFTLVLADLSKSVLFNDGFEVYNKNSVRTHKVKTDWTPTACPSGQPQVQPWEKYCRIFTDLSEDKER